MEGKKESFLAKFFLSEKKGHFFCFWRQKNHPISRCSFSKNVGDYDSTTILKNIFFHYRKAMTIFTNSAFFNFFFQIVMMSKEINILG